MADYLYRFLDTDGVGTGTKNAIGDYSSTPATFFIAPRPHGLFSIQRMIVFIEDTGLDAPDYGGVSALTNGITVQVTNPDGIVSDMTDGVPIKTNAGWGRQCYDVERRDWGSGSDFLVVRWTFTKAGQPVTLDGDKGERLEVVLSDNFTGISQHYFQVQGFSYTEFEYDASTPIIAH